MYFKNFFKSAVLAFSISVLFCASIMGETGDPSNAKSYAEYLPPNTVLLIEIVNMPLARKKFMAMPAGKWWVEGPGRKYIDSFLKGGFADDDGKQFIREVVRTTRIAPGKIAVCMVANQHVNPDDDPLPGEPGTMILADAGPIAPEIAAKLKFFMEYTDMTYGDEAKVDMYLYGAKVTATSQFAYGTRGNIALAAINPEATGQIFMNLNAKPVLNLANEKLFQEAMQFRIRDDDWYAYYNLDFTKKMMADGLSANENRMVEDMGFNQLKSAVVSDKITESGVVDKFSFTLSGEPKGYWPLIKPVQLTRNTWTALPADTSGFFTFNIDLANRYKKIEELQKRTMSPEEYEYFISGYKDFRNTTGISASNDLIPLLAGEITVGFLDEPTVFNPGDMPKSEALTFFAFEIKDTARLKDLWRQIVDKSNEPGAAFKISETVLNERKAYLLKTQEGMKYYCLLDGNIGYLAFYHYPIKRITEVLAGKTGKLVDSGTFKDAVSWIPKETGFAAYSSRKKILTSFYKSLYQMFEGEQPPDFPSLDVVLKDTAPLSASLSTQKGSFTFEIHSPDGLMAFYGMFISHMFYRMEDM